MKRFKLFCIIVAVSFMAVVLMSSCTSQSEKNELIDKGREIGYAQGASFGADSIKSSIYCINITAIDKNDSIILVDEHYVAVRDKSDLGLLEAAYRTEIYKFAMVDSVMSSSWKVTIE